jgi:hypothetical protein
MQRHEAAAAGLQKIALADGLVLHIVSRVDAELEHHANSQHQVYFGNGVISLRPGGWGRAGGRQPAGPTRHACARPVAGLLQATP